MAGVSRDRDRARLERELETDEYQELLRGLQGRESFLRQFATWADVIAFMRAGTSRDPRKDEVLQPIFKAHAAGEDPRWRAILLAIFWPGLESIHFKRRHWDDDADERWQNIAWTFLGVVWRVDVRRRRDRLVQKIVNDTVHRLHDEYRRAWNRTKREFTAAPEEIEALAGGAEDIDTAGFELRETQKVEINRLREHLEAGRITEAGFLLLVGTRVYKQSVADYARGAGLDFRVAQSRRRRAEASIRRYEKRLERSAGHASPSKALDPPLGGEGGTE